MRTTFKRGIAKITHSIRKKTTRLIRYKPTPTTINNYCDEYDIESLSDYAIGWEFKPDTKPSIFQDGYRIRDRENRRLIHTRLTKSKSTPDLNACDRSLLANYTHVYTQPPDVYTRIQLPMQLLALFTWIAVGCYVLLSIV